MLEDFLLQQVQFCDKIAKDTSYYNIGRTAFLKEFRTIALLLPRRSGKTTTLKSMHQNYSSLMFSKYRLDRNDRTLESFDYETMYRGRIGTGAKYRFVLLDEYSTVPDKVYTLCDFMIRHSFMETNPTIIALATP